MTHAIKPAGCLRRLSSKADAETLTRFSRLSRIRIAFEGAHADALVHAKSCLARSRVFDPVVETFGIGMHQRAASGIRVSIDPCIKAQRVALHVPAFCRIVV